MGRRSVTAEAEFREFQLTYAATLATSLYRLISFTLDLGGKYE
jgi:hypothetical protein